MSTVHSNKPNPQVLWLYANNVRALIIHFTLNAIIGILFAIAFALVLHFSFLWLATLSLALTISWSVESLEHIEDYTGYLVDCLGKNTHVVVRNGYWPMFLAPLFKLNRSEEVNFQVEDIEIPRYITVDADGLPMYVSGLIKLNVGDEIDSEAAAAFTRADVDAFEILMQTKGKTESSSIVMNNSFLPKAGVNVDTLLLRNSTNLNNTILGKLDPAPVAPATRKKMLVDFGIELTECIFTIEPTPEAMKIMETRIGAEEFSRAVADYKTKHNCTTAEAESAVNSSRTKVIKIDTGAGGGAAFPVINIGGKP